MFVVHSFFENQKLKNYFLSEIIEFFSKTYKDFEKKLLILLPIYGLRWILIILNCFNQSNLNNRFIELKQLRKAKKMLERIVLNG